jgi:hypothetical protein
MRVTSVSRLQPACARQRNSTSSADVQSGETFRRFANRLRFDNPEGRGGSAARASVHIDSIAASIWTSVIAYLPARFIPAKVRLRSFARR